MTQKDTQRRSVRAIGARAWLAGIVAGIIIGVSYWLFFVKESNPGAARASFLNLDSWLRNLIGLFLILSGSLIVTLWASRRSPSVEDLE